MVATHIKKIKQCTLYVTGVYLRGITNMIFVILHLKLNVSHLSICSSCLNSLSLPPPPSGELWTQKLKSHLVRTQSLNILPFKPGVGLYIAIRATLRARDFFLAYFYLSGPFTCNFSKTSPNFFCVSCG